MLIVRPATLKDIPGITAIYAEAVANGVATWETDVPDEAEIRRRFETITTAGYPYLVAENGDGAIWGYAYANTYRPRAAYRYTVENSIYVDPSAQGRGVGRQLMAGLIKSCVSRGYRQMVAVIGDSANLASIGLHKAAGFETVGVARSVGFKHGRWLDQVLMARPLGDGDTSLPI